MKRFITFFFFLSVLTIAGAATAAQEGATKLADGVYGIKGIGEAINTAFVVGDRGVFVYSCDLSDYDRRSKIIRETAGSKPIRFVANGHYAFDDVGCNHMFAEQGATVLGEHMVAADVVEGVMAVGDESDRLAAGRFPDYFAPPVIVRKIAAIDEDAAVSNDEGGVDRLTDSFDAVDAVRELGRALLRRCGRAGDREN